MLNEDKIIGCLLGVAIGDSIGLPYEGLTRRRGEKILGVPDRHRFFFGYGMISDDTEHTCMVAQSLIASNGDPTRFQKSLAWRLRFWLLGIPAGIGFATLRAILKLWIGIPPDKSGVFSAGNGPAMRAAIIGVAAPSPQAIRDLVRVSSRLTHTDPKAEYGAFAVALAAHLVSLSESVTPTAYLEALKSFLEPQAEELLSLVEKTVASVHQGQTTLDFADSLNLTSGVSGYVYHTVPIALHTWLSYPNDFRSAITTIIRCGGDTDSTAAVVGGIIGASVGHQGIPKDWLAGLKDYPQSVAWMERLGKQLADSTPATNRKPPTLPILGIAFRNLIFAILVLSHGFRRLTPPH